MKKNIEELQRDGKMTNFFKILVCIISCYLIYTFIFYINDEIFHFYGLVLHWIGKPLSFYIAKWMCALILIVAILNLNKNIKLYYIIANIASMGVLSMIPINFAFYQSYVDLFLLEIISISLIIYTNKKWFIEKYMIKRGSPLLISFGILSLLIAFVLFLYIFNFI